MPWSSGEVAPGRKRAANMHVNKGKRGERELAHKFIEIMETVEQELGLLGASIEVKRNLQQSIDGGHDIVGIPVIAVEVKRRETLDLNSWWKQTVSQAPSGEMPVLIYRQNRKAWRVMSFTLLNAPPYAAKRWIVSDYTLDDFFSWYREIYADWLLTRQAE